MSRCKACDSMMTGKSQAYMRTVTLKDGTTRQIEEDLCWECRRRVFEDSLPDDFDFIEGLGTDVDY